MAIKKLIDITNKEIEAIYDSGKEATVQFIRMLVDKINDINEIVLKQQEEIIQLKAIIQKHSQNSNKPPSSDNPFKKKTKSLRKKGGKAGGQNNHKGTNLKQVNNPDEIIPCRIEGKCSCGKSLKKASLIGIDKRQIFDLPEIQIKVTEYQADIVLCECGKNHTAQFPEFVKSKAGYGNTIKSLAVYLKHHGFLSYERIQEFFRDVLNRNISQGTLVNFVNECAKNLQPFMDKIQKKMINEDLLHFDETGFRIEGSLHWLHCAGNSQYTMYHPHKNRGKKAMDSMGILPDFNGIAVHDHWDSYYLYTNCLHSLCNGHHLRELIYFEEQEEARASRLIGCLLDARDDKEKYTSIPPPGELTAYYKQRMRRIINTGLKSYPEIKKQGKTRGRQKQTPEHNLLMRLKNYLDDVLRFLYDNRVPFDNNSGERDIRMTKVQQKVSGTFRSFKGAESFCIIRGYISTLKKHGLSAFKGICAGFDNIDLPGLNDC